MNWKVNMATVQETSRGIFSLPNEILLATFDLLETKELIALTPTCQQFHTLVLRLIHNRLQLAADLDGHTLFLECFPPHAEYQTKKMHCVSLGTNGLEELLSGIYDDQSYLGQIKTMFGLYSRFRPQVNEPRFRLIWRHPAGDVRGSRTHPDSVLASSAHGVEVVSEVVSIDASDLFSQLQTRTYLGKREQSHGILNAILGMNKGTIRVWRHWLADHCESKNWTDGEPIVIHHDTPSDSSGDARTRSDSVTGYVCPSKDPKILWLNTGDQNLGIKMRVKERQWRRVNPLLHASDVDLPVSYRVEFEEVYIRTTHLLVKLEEAQRMVDDGRGKAIVFGSFRGDTSQFGNFSG